MNLNPVETTKRAITSKRAYAYADRQGAPVEAFVAFGWHETMHRGRCALEYPTATGPRWRYLDDQKPRHDSPPGYKMSWYGLERALTLDAARLILINGAPGVVATQWQGLPTFCVSGGESPMFTPAMIQQLQAVAAGREIIIAMDSDMTGQQQAARRTRQLIDAGFIVRAVDLQLGEHGDFADFCKQHGDETLAALGKLPEITPDEPKTHKIGYLSASAGRWQEFVQSEVMTALERVATVRTKTHFQCINPEHVDNHPSARITQRGVYVCTCGNHSMKTVAGWLGLDYRQWLKDTYPLPKPMKRSQKHAARKTEARPWPPKLPTVKLETLRPDNKVEARYVTELDLSARTIALKSALNTGKTGAQIRHIEQHKPRRVLFLTYLQTLSSNLVERLNESNIDHPFEWYLEIPQKYNLSAIDRLVCSLNSLYRLQGGAAYDLIIIDEMEQTIRALWDGTMKSEEALIAFATLKEILSKAGQVIALDAHMSNEASALLNAIRGDCTKIENTYRHQWGDLVMHRDEAALIEAAQICADRNEGCVVITTGSRAAARRYRRYFENRYGSEQVRLIYGWNSASKESRTFVRQINEALPKLRIFITSPTVGTGVDIQAQVAGVFGHFPGDHLAATDILQQIARYRNAAQRAIFIEHKQRHKITSAGKLLERERSKAKRTAHLAEFAQFSTVNVTEAQAEMTKLWATFTAATNCQKTNLLAYFVELAKHEGFTIQWSSREAPTIKAALKTNAQALREEDDQKTLTLSPVSNDELDMLRMTGELTEDDFLGNLRSKIEHTTGYDITEELLTAYKRPQQRAGLRRFTDYLSAVEFVQQKDRDNVKVLPFKRSHHVANRALFDTALHTVFGEKGLTSTEVIEAPELEQRITQFIDANRNEIQRLDERPDLSMKPIAAYRRLLNRFGVRLTSKEARLSTGRKGMVYWLDQDQITVLIERAKHRMAHLESLSKNAGTHTSAPYFRDFRHTLPHTYHLPPGDGWQLSTAPHTSKAASYIDALLHAPIPVNPFSSVRVGA